MGKTAIVTGAAGQDGSYMVELLLAKPEYERVYAVVRPSGRLSHSMLRENYDTYKDRLTILEGDILNLDTIDTLCRIGADEFYHFAALTHVGQSFKQPVLWLETNTIATTRILEKLRELSPATKLYHAATSELMPTGPNKFNAKSPYAASKLAAHLMCNTYRDSYGMFIVSGIAYNHESPRRGINFVTQKIVQNLKHIKNPRVMNYNKLKLGTKDIIRDWHHAKDTVKGIWMAMQYERPVNFVFASGVGVRLEVFANLVCERLDLDPDKVLEWGCEEFIRPNEVPYLQGNPMLTKRLLGWQREYDLKNLVEDMING